MLALGSRILLDGGEELFRLGDSGRLHLPGIAGADQSDACPCRCAASEQDVLVEERARADRRMVGADSALPVYPYAPRRRSRRK